MKSLSEGKFSLIPTGLVDMVANMSIHNYIGVENQKQNNYEKQKLTDKGQYSDNM